MADEIKCPGDSLEGFILYGEQVPAYRSFSGAPDPKKVDKRIIEHYTLGKRYAEQFRYGKEFLESLKFHTENCKKCLNTIAELRAKYESISIEELEKISEKSEGNLRYFGLLRIFSNRQ